MKVRFLAFFVAVFIMAITGCAHLQKDIDSNTEEISELQLAIEELDTKVNNIDIRMTNLERRIDDMENISDKMTMIGDERLVLEGRIAGIENEIEALKTRNLATIKIKVLSGDGKISSARKAAKRLQSLGYKVSRTDLAPTKNFKGNRVFYAANFRDEAEKIALNLGLGTKVKPLTWRSVFDIIVVSVKR